MGESHRRSLAKSVTWRIVATTTTITLVWLFTGEVRIALAVGGIEVIAKIVVFYFHERAWAAVGWGTRG